MNDEIQELMAENERLSEEIKRTREKLDLAEKYIRDNVDSKAPDYIKVWKSFYKVTGDILTKISGANRCI